MISDLNSDNGSGIEWFKPQFELAGVLLYIRKIPKDLSLCIENGRRESGAAQHLSPRVKQRVGRFQTLRTPPHTIRFGAPLRR